MIIHHIATSMDWVARDDATYAPEGLAVDGFVHASFPNQVVATANAWFARRRDLLLLTIDTERLTSPVVVEDTSGHGDFPHVYGPIDLVAVITAHPFQPDNMGTFNWWTPTAHP